MNPNLRAVDQLPDTPTKPWMRLACMLYASGTPFVDIAREVNMPIEAISDWCTSTRGMALMTALVAENPERLAAVIEASTLDSLLKIVRLRDTGKTEQVQLSAATQLLDRFFPKTKATEGAKGRVPGTFTNLDEEISRLREEVGQAVT